MSHFVEIVKNYIFLQCSILLFAAPFYLLYKRRHPEFSFKHLLRNTHMEEFLSSREANWLVFAWAAAEAVCWFIIPEFLLLLVIFLRVKNKVALLSYDIAGTVVGTIVGLVISVYGHFDVTKIPYVTENMAHQVHAWYQSFGVLGLFFQPFSGVPYKVFVFNVYQLHIHFIAFVVVAVVVRMTRYYLFYLLFSGLYPFLHRLVSRNYIPILMIACFAFSVLFLKVYHAYGPEYVIDTGDAKAMGRELLLIKDRLHR